MFYHQTVKDNTHDKVPSKSAPLEASSRHKKGPEPERFKVEGYANWEDAVKVALRKSKPKGGWPK